MSGCYFIGIDGGGTKTAFALCDETGRLLRRFSSGASNPNDIGFEPAVSLLCNGISRLTAGLPETAALHVFAGLAGGISGENQQRLHKALTERMGDTVTLQNHSDLINALNCGTHGRDGAVLICGTGMIGCLRRGEEFFRVGGYGFLLDQGGSGFALGRDALCYTLRVMDGRTPSSPLSVLCEAQAGGVWAHLDELYQSGKARIAAFAPLVFTAYEQGDRAAKHILDHNMAECAGVLERLWELNGETECTVVLSGGIFHRWELLKPFLQKHLHYPFSFVFPAAPPVYGAVLEAARKAKVPCFSAFAQTLLTDMQADKLS